VSSRDEGVVNFGCEFIWCRLLACKADGLQTYGFGNGAGVRNPNKQARPTAFHGGKLTSDDEFRIGRESMRLIALALAAVVAAAAPAQAAWKAQKYPQYGFGVDFPGEPRSPRGEYRGVIAGRVPPPSSAWKKTAPSIKW
jgi:hypothetical protein